MDNLKNDKPFEILKLPTLKSNIDMMDNSCRQIVIKHFESLMKNLTDNQLI